MKLGWFLLFLLLWILLIVFAAQPTTVVSLDSSDAPVLETIVPPGSTLSVFSTSYDTKYLEFLTTFNYQYYDIVDITTCLKTFSHGDSYVVTYSKKTETSNVDTISYKYYLFKTNKESDFLDFYSLFDFDTFEIVDISIVLNGPSYVITYREPN